MGTADQRPEVGVVDAPTWHSGVLDSRMWQYHETGCPGCGGPTQEFRKRFCSPRCKTKAKRARRRNPEHREGNLPDRCAHCLQPIKPRIQRSLCPRCRKRRAPYQVFRGRVKWPHDLAWLARKLGLPADDLRLPDIALRLAEAGELVVYIRVDGTVGEVGRPRPSASKGIPRYKRQIQLSDQSKKSKQQTRSGKMEIAHTTSTTEGRVTMPDATLRGVLLQSLKKELGRGITITEKKAYTRITRGKVTLAYVTGSGRLRLDIGPNGRGGRVIVRSDDDIAAAVAAIRTTATPDD
jgi:hypothetical protein